MKNFLPTGFGNSKALLLIVMSGILTVGLVGCNGSFNVAPTAVIEDTVNSQTSNVTFDLSQSHDPDGSIISYEFYPRYDTQPGTVITENEEFITTGGWDSITESPPSGEYTARLVVTDDEGKSDEVTESYIID